MKKLFIFLTIISISLLACKKDKIECEEVTLNFLQGSWDDNCLNCGGFGGSRYKFTFYNTDSFYIHKSYYSDVLSINCPEASNGNVYIKGRISEVENEYNLNGVYCDENYNIKQIPTCSALIDTGQFILQFKSLSFCNDTLNISIENA